MAGAKTISALPEPTFTLIDEDYLQWLLADIGQDNDSDGPVMKRIRV